MGTFECLSFFKTFIGRLKHIMMIDKLQPLFMSYRIGRGVREVLADH